ncbi:hypothetical protein SK128_007071 [Halocaridina rubra]|uniref:Uncharacterized protein n=1 Tax=Halocaridina rubra TaxID=373956 RepID=A0AAN8XAA2_HALRR
MKLLITTFLYGIILVSAERGPQLWEVKVNAHHRVVRTLEEEGHADIWSHKRDVTKLLVEPHVGDRVARELRNSDIEYSVVVPDVLELVEQERVHMLQKKNRAKRAATPMDWTSYHDFDDISGLVGWLNVSQGDWVHVVQASTTAEGRPVLVVKVTNPNAVGPKKKIWIEGDIKSDEEWQSGSTQDQTLQSNLYDMITAANMDICIPRGKLGLPYLVKTTNIYNLIPRFNKQKGGGHQFDIGNCP